MDDLTRIEYLELVNQMISTYEQRIETNNFKDNGTSISCPICIKMIVLTADGSYKCTRCPNNIDSGAISGCIEWASYTGGSFIRRQVESFARRRLEVFKELKIELEEASDTLSVEGMRGLQAKVHFKLGY